MKVYGSALAAIVLYPGVSSVFDHQPNDPHPTEGASMYIPDSIGRGVYNENENWTK